MNRRRLFSALTVATLALLLAACGGGGEKTTANASTVEGNVPQAGQGGDTTKGKDVFTENGCGSCHTFAAAGTTSPVGPSLDELESHASEADRGDLAEYTHESIVNPNAYVVSGFSEGVMPPNYGEQLSAEQISDLVAFLTS